MNEWRTEWLRYNYCDVRSSLNGFIISWPTIMRIATSSSILHENSPDEYGEYPPEHSLIVIYGWGSAQINIQHPAMNETIINSQVIFDFRNLRFATSLTCWRCTWPKRLVSFESAMRLPHRLNHCSVFNIQNEYSCHHQRSGIARWIIRATTWVINTVIRMRRFCMLPSRSPSHLRTCRNVPRWIVWTG